QRDSTNKVKDVRDHFERTGRLSMEEEAREKEKDAERKEKDAAEREQSVKDKPREDAERKKAEEEAAKLREQAQQLRQQAHERRDKRPQAEENQRQVRDAIENQKKEGVRADVERIRETLRQNPLPRSGSEKRMERVAEELDRLTQDVLPKV